MSTEAIANLSSRELLDFVLKTDDPSMLREIAGVRFGHEAKVENDDLLAPFIRWPVINQGLQAWLPVLTAKVAKADFSDAIDGATICIIAAPRSATPYLEHIQTAQIFPHAFYPGVLKQSQIDAQGIIPNGAKALAVPSYVHERNPQTHARGTQEMFFFDTDCYAGSTVVLFDDALAEGETAITIGEFLKNNLGADKLFVSVPMSKPIQGGHNKLLSSNSIDGLSVLIHVTQTGGRGMPIAYHTNGKL